MIVIADTSPLNYAVRIGVADALFDLYGEIVVPAAVHLEVLLPDDPALNVPHAGEAQAIFLAEETPNSLLIIDEREGRAEARRRGIAVTGLLGVIRDGAIRGYLHFEEALAKLKETDFRLSNEIEAIVRKQYRKSRNERQFADPRTK